MKNPLRIVLGTAALVAALSSVALGQRYAEHTRDIVGHAPHQIDAFALAELLSEAPPNTVVVTLDTAEHPLRGALPAQALGNTDDELVQAAPKHRRTVLVGHDSVRVDRIARRLVKDGRDVLVLEGGREAWDRFLKADPPPPGPGARGRQWARYRQHVALRRSFADAENEAPPTVVVAPPPVPAAVPAVAKKREGC